MAVKEEETDKSRSVKKRKEGGLQGKNETGSHCSQDINKTIPQLLFGFVLYLIYSSLGGKNISMVKMSPDVFSCSDDEGNLDIEIDMFGVKKENIELKMVEDGFFVRGKREETGVEYVGTYAFCCGVVPEKAVAKYVDGKLYVKVPYRESTETVDVKIQ